jgi:hypothetical protein
MNRRRKPIATAIMVAALATGLSPAAEVLAADTDEVQELQREVRQMRAQVQALVAAIAETTELEKQRSANFSRALQQPAATSEPAARAPGAPASGSEAGGGAGETKPAAAPAPAGDDHRRGPARHRHHRSSGRPRSKVR